MSREQTLKKYKKPKWLIEIEDKSKSEEVLELFIKNKERIDKYISEINDEKVLYRTVNWIFSIFFKLASGLDWVLEKVQNIFLQIPVLQYIMEKIKGIRNDFDLRDLVLFLKTKIYSLKNAPHNEKAIKEVDEIIKLGKLHGLDFNKHFPKIKQRLSDKKSQLMQHKFFQEFSKGWTERLLAIPFHFEKSIYPVLPDSAFWHNFYGFLENILIKDIILVDEDSKKTSFKKSTEESLKNNKLIKQLKEISKIKNNGHRIFFIGHHEGYLSPYFVRNVLRKIGFDNLTKDCNTIVGPRMFSNLFLRNGAANVGNLFTAIPSQKTTKIKTKGLAKELRKAAMKSQFLIKMPNSGLKLIKNLEYEEFMSFARNYDKKNFKLPKMFLEKEEIRDLRSYMELNKNKKTIKKINKDEFTLFKKIMNEPFLMFPEGSRSYIDKDGSIVLKYINPRYIEAYMRPGDYIVPVSLVGGSDMTKGLFMRPGTLGLAIVKEIKLTKEKILNYKTEGVDVMKLVAKLPNIKKVKFNTNIQEGKKNKFKK